MKCQKCNINEATTHYTEIINGKKTEYFLCEECAKGDKILKGFKLGFDNEFDNLFSGFFGNTMGIKAPETTVCRGCKMTFDEFLKGGRLGCSECYDTFASRLIKPLKQIHGSCEHMGKIPERLGLDLKKTRNIEKLEAELNNAIAEQNFEEAAKLRDKIKELKEN